MSCAVHIRVNTGVAVFEYDAVGDPAMLEQAAIEAHGVCSVTTMVTHG